MVSEAELFEYPRAMLTRGVGREKTFVYSNAWQDCSPVAQVALHSSKLSLMDLTSHCFLNFVLMHANELTRKCG